jgi:hypothetical protein
MTARSAAASVFTAFAQEARDHGSPLYAALSLAIAEDDALLALAGHARAGQPPANLLFASVQLLLQQHPRDPLGCWYPSLSTSRAPADPAFPAFQNFCRSHREDLIPLLRERLVQTNEVRRCSYLYPAFLTLARLHPGRPLALFEIGAAAGFNLQWDRYHYRYQDGIDRADPSSRLLIEAQLLGASAPDWSGPLPEVASRTGIDLHPLHAGNPEHVAWLRALIWPEHQDRRRLLEAAIEVTTRNPPLLIEGDAVDLLPGLLDAVPAGHLPCVYHTHVANQIPPARLELLLQRLDQQGRRRDLVHLYNNIGLGLRLRSWRDAESQEQLLAEIDGHGRTFTWRGPGVNRSPQ